MALILAGRFLEAVDWAKNAILVPNCQDWARAHLAAALGYLERRDEAAAALLEMTKVKPDFSLDLAREKLFYLDSREQVELYLEGLRRAGLRG